MIDSKYDLTFTQWSLAKNTWLGNLQDRMSNISDKADRFLINELKDKIVEVQKTIMNAQEALIENKGNKDDLIQNIKNKKLELTVATKEYKTISYPSYKDALSEEITALVISEGNRKSNSISFEIKDREVVWLILAKDPEEAIKITKDGCDILCNYEKRQIFEYDITSILKCSQNSNFLKELSDGKYGKEGFLNGVTAAKAGNISLIGKDDKAILEVINQNDDFQSSLLCDDKVMKFGRDSFSSQSRTISNTHCSLQLITKDEKETLIISDLGSTYGTVALFPGFNTEDLKGRIKQL